MTSVPKRKHRLVVRQATAVVATIIALVAIAGWLGTARPARIQSQAANLQHARAVLAKLPMAFEPNVGQTDQSVKYLARGSGYTVFLTGQEAVLRLKRPAAGGESVVSLKFAGAQAAKTETLERQSSITNYYIGDRSQWHQNVPNYGAIRYSEVYPGVDAVMRGAEGNFRYDYVVKPGADPSAIRLAMGGIKSMKLDGGGDLVLNGGDFSQPKPFIYQSINGKQRRVDGGYVLMADNQIGFHVAGYDRSRDLVIDPTFLFGTYVAGTGVDNVRGIAQDNSTGGEGGTQKGLYLVGDTDTSSAFPVGGAQLGAKPGALSDAFVIGMNRDGSAVAFRTFVGGAGVDIARGVALGSAGATQYLYVTGDTTSTDFAGLVKYNGATGTLGALTAATNGVLPGGGQVAFVLVVSKLDGTISTVANAVAMLGPSGGTTFGNSIVSDGAGNMWVGGSTTAGTAADAGSIGTWTTLASSQATYQGGSTDGYVAKLTISGGAPTIAVSATTFIGGQADDTVNALALTGSNVIAVGTTSSDSSQAFPTTNGSFHKNKAGGQDAFVVSVANNLLGAVNFGTFFGGDQDDSANAVAVDAANPPNIYITGQTTSSSGISTANAFQRNMPGTANAYVAKFSTTVAPATASIAWASYLGGGNSAGPDVGYGIAVDNFLSSPNNGPNVYVVGQSGSADFPHAYSPSTGSDPLTGSLGAGTSVAFLARFNPTGTALNYSGVDGKGVASGAYAIAVDTATGPITAFFGGFTGGGIDITPGPGFQQGFVNRADGFATALKFYDVGLTVNPVALSIVNGAPGTFSGTTILNFTTGVGINPARYTVNACPIALTDALPAPYLVPCANPAPSWLPSVTTANYNAGTRTLTLTVDPSAYAAATTLQSGNYAATVQIIGPYDNNPSVVTVTLSVSNTLSTNPAGPLLRYFQKDNLGPVVQHVVGSSNQDSDSVEVFLNTPPSLQYSATVDRLGLPGELGCTNQGSWVTVGTPAVGATNPASVLVPLSHGTNLRLNYDIGVLQSMDLRNVETPDTTPTCTARIKLMAPNNGNVATLYVDVPMRFFGHLIAASPDYSPFVEAAAPSVSLSPLNTASAITTAMTFDFVDKNSPAQSHIVTLQGDKLPLSFTPGVAAVTFAGNFLGSTCVVGATVSPLSGGVAPFVAPDTTDAGLLNFPANNNALATSVSFAVTVNPINCANNTDYMWNTGAGAQITFTPTVSTTPSCQAASQTPGTAAAPCASSGFTKDTATAGLIIPINMRIGRTMQVSAPNPVLFTGPKVGGIRTDSAGYQQTGFSVASDQNLDLSLAPPTSAQTATITNIGDPNLTFPISLTVTTQAAVGGGACATYSPVVGVATTPAPSVTTSWLKVTSSTATVGGGSNATLTFAVDPAIWNGLPSTATGCGYPATVVVSSPGVPNSPWPAIPVLFTKVNQPVVLSSVAPLNFQGIVGQGLLTAQSVTVGSPNAILNSGTLGSAAYIATYSADAKTYSLNNTSYPGYDYPADGSVGQFDTPAPLFTYMPAAPTSWLQLMNSQNVGNFVSPPTLQVTANTTNLTPSPILGQATGGSCAAFPGTLLGNNNNCAVPYVGTVRVRNGTAVGNSYSGQNVVEVPVTFLLNPAPAISIAPSGTVMFSSTLLSTLPASPSPLTKSVTATSSSIAIPFTLSVTAATNGVQSCPITATAASTGTVNGTATVGGDVINIVVPAACLNGTLPAGTYLGNVQVNAPTGAVQVQNIAVSLVINPAPMISADPAVLTPFAFTIGTTPSTATQSLAVSSGGTGFSAAFVPTAGGPLWATVTSPTTTPTIGLNAAVVSGLGAGSYTGNIVFTDVNASNSLSIPVSLTVSPLATLSVAPSATVNFNGAVGAANPPAPQVLSITVGNGPVPLTLAGAVPAWLNATLSPASPATTSAATLTFSINQAAVNALTPGVLQTATFSIGSTQPGVQGINPITVNLTVGTISLYSDVSAFTPAFTLGGATAPQSRLVNVSGSQNGLVVNVVSSDPSWLTFSQAGGTVPTQVTITATLGSKTTTQNGTITLTSPSGGTPVVIPVTMTVNAQPTLASVPASISYAYAIGSLSLPAVQTAAITSIPAGATGLVATVSGANCGWLGFGLNGTTAPVTLNTSVLNATGLVGGNTYTCNVMINGTDANPAAPIVQLTIPVSIVVAAQPVITPNATSMSFAYVLGGVTPPVQVLAVSTTNPVGQVVGAAATSTPAGWLTVMPSASAGTFNIAVTPGTLAAGTYAGSIALTLTNATTVNVPVSFTVIAPVITPAPGSTAFSYVLGGAAPAGQTAAISTSPVGLTVIASSNAPWLVANVAGSALNVSVVTTGLLAGTYNGLVTLSTPGAPGSNVTFPVSLTVAAPVINAPASLAFAYMINGNAPASQPVLVTTTPAGGVVTAVAASAGNWLTANLVGTTLTVSANPTGLTAGAYTGTITLTSPNATPVVIAVTFTVTAQPTVTVTPTSASFAYTITGAVPVSQTLPVGSNPPGQALSASSCGAAWLGFSLTSGTAPSNLVLSVNPTGLAATTYTCNVTVAAPGAFAGNVMVTLVVSSQPVINAATTPLAFGFVQGGTAPASQTVAVTSTPSQAVTSAVATTSGGNWLGAVLSGGTLTVSAIPTGLAAGTYNGSITLSSSLAANVTIPVSFVVTTPVISCNAANANFAFLQGAAVPAPQTGTCTTTPSGLALSSAVATTSGGAWLTASLSSGTLTITAAPGTLANGVYNGSVTISTPGAANVVIPASLTVTTPVIIAPTAQVNYNFVIGGTAPGSQAVAVTTTPTGVAVTATPSAAWLVASLSGSTLSISVNQAGLAAGTYTGSVTLTAPGAANVVIPVVFGVAAQPVIGPVTPGSLSFGYTTGGAVPATQSVIVGNASNLTLSATAVGTWLSATLSPASGNPAGLTVAVNPTGLAAGTYNGSITLAGAGAVSVSIPVSFTVTAAATIPFFTGQVALSNGVYYLSFPNGGLFGYFSYMSSGLIYHFDMGYEAVQNANDGSNGVYMYDFKSGHWWYSNPASFPYVYDFTLRSWIYYFPSTAGHYTTSPRSFANLTTGLVFTM